MVTYVNDLRLSELATGEGSGTWGTTTNQSLELIGEALGYATQQAFGSDADATTTVADGVSDPARAMYFKVTSAGSLSATRTLTIAPNTISRVMFIENATTGSQSIAISQGSGANVTIATGKTAVVYLDGAGATAAVVDAMAGVDPGVTDTLTEVLVAGNTSGGTNIELSTTDKVQFRDTGIYINSSVDGQLDIVADTEIQIAATTIDVNGTLAFDSLKGTGATTVTNILDEDNMASDSATAIATQQSIKAYVDSQVGSFDTLAEVLAQGNTTGGTDLAVSTGDDITFADSSKAIFGAGSDLEIYHDGSNSYIKDQGTGNLNIQTNGVGVVIADTSASDLAVFNAGNGQVSLFNSGSLKLTTTATGIDVTGTVTADGLTVDGNVGIGQTSPTAKLEVNGVPNATIQPSNAIIKMNSSGGNGLYMGNVGASSYASYIQAAFVSADSPDVDYNLLLQPNGGNVGIGTSSPLSKLNVKGTQGNWRVDPDSVSGEIQVFSTTTANDGFRDFRIRTQQTIFDTAGTERMRIDSSGNVGIGTSSPQTSLSIETSGTQDVVSPVVTGQTAGVTYGGLYTVRDGAGDQRGLDLKVYTANVGLNTAMRIDSSGNVGIGTAAPESIVHIKDTGDVRTTLQIEGAATGYAPVINFDGIVSTNADYLLGEINGSWDTHTNVVSAIRFESGADTTNKDDGLISFWTSSSGPTLEERMRIDTSGNVLIGGTSAFGADTITLGTGGFAGFRNTSGSCLELRRDSTDGTILDFQKDGTAVGSIATVNSNIYLGTGDTGLYFNAGDDTIMPINVSTASGRDAGIDLGKSDSRFKDLYLSGGVVFGDAGGSGTPSSNTLDNYEEGAWTPSLTNIGTGTYVIQVGRYTKVGNLVTANFHLDIGVLGTASGNLIITGLPFTASSVTANYGSITTTHASGWDAGYMNLGGLVDPATANFPVYYQNSSGVMTAATHANMQVGNFLGTIIYETA